MTRIMLIKEMAMHASDTHQSIQKEMYWHFMCEYIWIRLYLNNENNLKRLERINRSRIMESRSRKSMIKNGWYCCPKCGRKLFPVGTSTLIRNLFYQCKHCKEKFHINIEPRAYEPGA